jgi:hypothetical protein
MPWDTAPPRFDQDEDRLHTFDAAEAYLAKTAGAIEKWIEMTWESA